MMGSGREWCLKCARWTLHVLAGRRGPLVLWRCRRCGAPVLAVADEVAGPAVAAAREEAYNES